MNNLPKFKAAAVHAASVYMDSKKTTAKTIALINEAAKNNAELVIFPESYIPGFPVWAALWAPIYNHDLFELMAKNSLHIHGQEIQEICLAAKRNQVFVSLGFSEISDISLGCIWNSYILISDQGEILIHHRKIVPTFYEKMVWAPGDGAGLRVAKTRIGNIGGLICGENTNPLARYSLIAQGEQVHISSWPALWPTKKPSEGGNFDNVAANRIRAGAHSFEAKVFGIICAGFMDKQMRDFLADRDPVAAEVIDNTPRAATMFLDPTGSQIGTMCQEEEGIAYADIDINKCIEPKQFHDVVGYYNRFDIFDLQVTRERTQPVKWIDRYQERPQIVDTETTDLSENTIVSA